MNKLSVGEPARILHLLCEGQSIRAIKRLTDTSKNTVTKLLIDAGKACVLVSALARDPERYDSLGANISATL